METHFVSIVYFLLCTPITRVKIIAGLFPLVKSLDH